MELRNTVEDMLSRDYKRRFRALLCAEHFLCMSTISGAVHWTPSIGGTYHRGITARLRLFLFM